MSVIVDAAGIQARLAQIAQRNAAEAEEAYAAQFDAEHHVDER